MGFPGGLVGKESVHSAGDLGSIPGLWRSPGEGKGYLLQYSGLENSMDWIVRGITRSRTWLSDFHFHFQAQLYGDYINTFLSTISWKNEKIGVLISQWSHEMLKYMFYEKKFFYFACIYDSLTLLWRVESTFSMFCFFLNYIFTDLNTSHSFKTKLYCHIYPLGVPINNQSNDLWYMGPGFALLSFLLSVYQPLVSKPWA